MVDDVKKPAGDHQSNGGKNGDTMPMRWPAAKRPWSLSKNRPVALLLLDMIMDPGIDGLETYQRIKEIRPDQKAILLSGFAENRSGQKKPCPLGAGRYMKKADPLL